jgi:transposase
MEAILALYAEPADPERPMVCFDEKSVQLLDDVRQPMPMTEAHSRRVDYEYKRHGTRNLFVFVAPKTGYRQILVTQHRRKEDFAHAMRYLVDHIYPDATMIDVVLDNLNTHHYHSLVEFFGKQEADRVMSRLCFHFTPPHGSWLNMAEIELSILSRQCLKQRLHHEMTLAMELLAWEERRNQTAKPFNWSFTVNDARDVFQESYPSDLLN